MKPKPNMAKTAATIASGSPMGCLHCGQAVALAGARFCCPGCQNVYEFLHQNKLDGYYQFLGKQQTHAPKQSLDTRQGSDLDTTAFARHFRAPGQTSTYTFLVPAMSCAACLWLMDKALGSIEGVTGVRVDLDRKLVAVATLGKDDSMAMRLYRRLQEVGYRPLPPRLEADTSHRDGERRKMLRDLGLAWVCFANVMLFATALYSGDIWGMNASMSRFFVWLSAIVTAIALPTAGRSFFVAAWSALKIRRLHMDLPIAVALLLAFAVSLMEMLRGSTHVYFDSITGLIALLLSARYLSDTMSARARRLAGAAESLIPLHAVELTRGAIVDVAAGEAIPADGIVIHGHSEVSEAALTGEEAPETKQTGAQVYAGTLNLQGQLRIRVTAAGPDSYLASLTRLINSAQSARGHYAGLADRILPWFTLGIFLAGILAAAWWWSQGAQRMIEVVAATLIVSCPCALALATPLLASMSLRRAWRHGLIVRSVDVLERLSKIDTIVLDKTGTLTSPRLEVVSSTFLGEKNAMTNQPPFASLTLKAAASSRHPVAQALRKQLEQGPDAPHGLERFELKEHREYPAAGIAAVVGDVRHGQTYQVYLGAPAWVQQMGVQCGVMDLEKGPWATGEAPQGLDDATQAVVLIIQRDNQQDPSTPKPKAYAARHYYLKAALLPEAKSVIQDWQRQGISVRLMSGDRAAPVYRIADQVGIPRELAGFEMKPEDKLAAVVQLQEGGATVLMVGDGVNDAPALARADVGAAVQGGVDVAIGAADVFARRPGLGPIADVHAFARHHKTSLIILLSASILYNLIAISLAISGFIHPIAAAAIMPLSSLSVIAVAIFRQGASLWKYSTSSCPLPSSSPLAPPSPISGPSTMGNSTT